MLVACTGQQYQACQNIGSLILCYKYSLQKMVKHTIREKPWPGVRQYAAGIQAPTDKGKDNTNKQMLQQEAESVALPDIHITCLHHSQQHYQLRKKLNNDVQ